MTVLRACSGTQARWLSPLLVTRPDRCQVTPSARLVAQLHRLRVCHVITGFDTGGAERVLLRTVRRLDSTRFEPFIVSLRPRARLSNEIEELGLETVYLNMGRRPGPSTLWRLARIFRRDVHLVHAYLYDASIASRIAGCF